MKKYKTFKSLSAIGATVAITPVIAVGCSNNNDPTPSEKTNVNTVDWTDFGDYLSTMSNDEIVTTFVANNKTIENKGTLPNDIY